MFKHVPNILTIIRFLLIPIIVIFAFQDDYIATIIVLTISGLTDVLDGYIARKFNFISDFGKLMDPLADKLTQVALLATLTIQKIIPIWIIFIVIIKEFLMVSGASFLYGKELVVSSKWYGKLATVLFYVAIVCSLFIQYWNTGNLITASTLPEFDTYIYYLAVLTTIFSLIMYVKAFYLQGYLKKALEQESNETDKKTDA